MNKMFCKSVKRIFTLFLALSIFLNFSPMVFVSAETNNAVSITLDKSELKLFIIDGITESQTLTATVIPSDCMGDVVDWTSSDTTVARVDSRGTVTAINAGTATITATTANNLQASCLVTVASYRTGCLDGVVYATGMTLNQTSFKLTCGEKKQSYTLNPSFSPERALPEKVQWSSSDSAVASVDDYGIVTAVNPGTAIITAKSTRSNLSASCTIEVATHFLGALLDVFPTAITLNKTNQTIFNQDNFVLETKLEPSNVTVKGIDWSSSDNSVATVDSNGKVTGITKGTAVITAKTKNNLQARCIVQVDFHPTGLIINVVLDQTTHTMNINDSFTLNAKCDVASKFEWSSSNKSVATVDGNGKVTGVGQGTAVITAKVFGSEQAQCIVRVNGVGQGTAVITTKIFGGEQAQGTVRVNSVFPNKVVLNKSSVTLGKGKSYSLKTKLVSNQDVTEIKLKWTSSNKKIAKVSTTGVVKALKKGNATITVKTVNGKVAKCKVRVVK